MVLVLSVRRYILHKRVTPNFLRQKVNPVIKKSQKFLFSYLSIVGKTVETVGKESRRLVRLPVAKRVIKFTKRYSAQLSFAILVAIFLTVTVGEGQAYNVDTPKLVAQLQTTQNDGFVGKPQIFGGQTILTGEIQQNVAIIYTVEKGDSITSIAQRYNLSVGTILDKNNIDPTKAAQVQPGTRLIVPAEDTNTSTAWLDAINKAKAEELARAEAARQKQLAQQRQTRSSSSSRSTVSTSSTEYTIIGRMWGQYNGGYPGQCTWYVNYVRPDLPNGMGNGGQYLASARARGMATGSIPRNGSIIVLNQSYYGHVGIVVGRNGDQVVVRDMNYAGPGVITQHSYNVNDPVIKGYVY